MTLDEAFDCAAAALKRPTTLPDIQHILDVLRQRVNIVHADEHFVIARETVVDLPGGEKDVLYAVFMNSPIFPTAHAASSAIDAEGLELGWVAIEAHRLIPVPSTAVESQGATMQQPSSALALAEQVLSMDLITPKGLRAKALAREVTMREEKLLNALRLIQHATAPSHGDGAYHENAYELATAAISEGTR